MMTALMPMPVSQPVGAPVKASAGTGTLATGNGGTSQCPVGPAPQFSPPSLMPAKPLGTGVLVVVVVIGTVVVVVGGNVVLVVVVVGGTAVVVVPGGQVVVVVEYLIGLLCRERSCSWWIQAAHRQAAGAQSQGVLAETTFHEHGVDPQPPCRSSAHEWPLRLD